MSVKRQREKKREVGFSPLPMLHFFSSWHPAACSGLPFSKCLTRPHGYFKRHSSYVRFLYTLSFSLHLFFSSFFAVSCFARLVLSARIYWRYCPQYLSLFLSDLKAESTLAIITTAFAFFLRRRLFSLCFLTRCDCYCCHRCYNCYLCIETACLST